MARWKHNSTACVRHVLVWMEYLFLGNFSIVVKSKALSLNPFFPTLQQIRPLGDFVRLSNVVGFYGDAIFDVWLVRE